jgi:hypothetical protein
LGPDARPIHRGSWRQTHSPWVQRHDPSVRCPQVGRGHGSRPEQPKHHMCAGVCQALRQEPKRHMYAGASQHTSRQLKRPRLGRPSIRWLQPEVRAAGVACLAPGPSSHASGVCSPPGRSSNLTLGFCRLQPLHMPPSTV